MLSFTMNASFSATRPKLKSSAGPTVPAKEVTQASIGRPVSSRTPATVDKLKTQNVADRPSTYRDFSHIVAPATTSSSSLTLWEASGKEPPFPVKLHRMLSSQQFRDVITWLPNGRAFAILDQEAFEKQVIPTFFKTGRFASFCRQLNCWGFRRVTTGKGAHAYYITR